MTSYPTLAAVLVVLAGSVGCEPTTIVNCPDPGFAGIGIWLEDSVTGLGLHGRRGEAVATDGTFSDTVRFEIHPAAYSKVALANNRPGTYTVTVTAEGYVPWPQSGVRVLEDPRPCYTVVTTWLTARMQPMPTP